VKPAALLRWATDVLFPRPCPGCDAPLATGHAGEFCATCAAALPWLREPFCAVCGDAFRVAAAPDGDTFADRICVRCRTTHPAFELARAAFRYDVPVRRAIHHLKFDGWRSLGRGLSVLMGEALSRDPGFFTGIDLVLPVPLYPARLRERGFNQAEELGRGLAVLIGAPMPPGLLERVVATPPQVGLSRSERLETLAGAFSCPDPGVFTDRTVLLVDDVMTTGATAHACAKAVRKAGARAVRVAVLARD
jgi:ComF family protein